MADDTTDYGTTVVEASTSNNFKLDLLAILHEIDPKGEKLHLFRDASGQYYVVVHPEIPRSVVCLWCAKRQTMGSYDQHRGKCKGINLLDTELTLEAAKAKLSEAIDGKKEGKKGTEALKKVNDGKNKWLNGFFGENGKHISC